MRYLAITEIEACSEPCQTTKMKRWEEVLYPLTNFVKPLTLDA